MDRGGRGSGRSGEHVRRDADADNVGAAATGGWKEMRCWRPWTGARKNPKSPRSESARPTAARSTTTPPCRASHATRNASSSRRRRWTRSTPRREARRRARGPDPGDRRAAGFSPTRLHPASDGFVGFGNPPRATASSRRIPSRTASTPVDTAKDASHRDGVATARPRRVARGPRWPHRVGHREPRGPIAAEGELGDARVRDDARCAGGGFGTTASWGRTHHVCYVRLCVLSATRACKEGERACGEAL